MKEQAQGLGEREVPLLERGHLNAKIPASRGGGTLLPSPIRGFIDICGSDRHLF